MSTMRILAVLLVVACSRDVPEPPPIVEHTRALANEMCGCTTRACADAVAKKWTEPLAGTQDLREIDLEQLLAQSKRYDRCLESITKEPR